MIDEVLESVDSTISGRLNTAEQKLHTLEHRITELSQKDLPHRVTNLESATNHMAEDLHSVKGTVARMSEKQDEEFDILKEAINSIKDKWSGGVSVLSVLFVILTLVIGVVGLMPKLDAVIIETQKQMPTD